MILGIGNDLVDCRRIEDTLKRFGSRFVNRVFTPQEQRRMSERVNQSAGYANLFAMKEAVLKALGTGLANGVIWQDIEIFREPQKAPKVQVYGMAQEYIKNQTPEGYTAHIHISVSDEWPYAQAFAMISAVPNKFEE